MKFENVPSNVACQKYAVVRVSNGKFWYYNSYDKPKKAKDIAVKVLGAVMVDHMAKVQLLPLRWKHYRYIIVRIAGGEFWYYGFSNSLKEAHKIAEKIKGGVLNREDVNG